MSTEHVIRAWRDEEYREALNAEQCAILPESPIGAIDLSERELAEAEGGWFTTTPWWPGSTIICIIA